MNLKQKLVSLFYFAFFSVLIVIPSQSDAQTEEEISNWVADQLGLEALTDTPQILFLDKENLGVAFLQGNKNAYYRWQRQYGDLKAQEILTQYLDDVVGLFNEKTEIIYVGTFIDECSQKAVLAHEIVHYYQYISEGIIPPGSYMEELSKLKREMQAYQIEEEFRKTFCPAAESNGSMD